MGKGEREQREYRSRNSETGIDERYQIVKLGSIGRTKLFKSQIFKVRSL